MACEEEGERTGEGQARAQVMDRWGVVEGAGEGQVRKQVRG